MDVFDFLNQLSTVLESKIEQMEEPDDFDIESAKSLILGWVKLVSITLPLTEVRKLRAEYEDVIEGQHFNPEEEPETIVDLPNEGMREYDWRDIDRDLEIK